MQQKYSQQGMSLLELLVVLVLIGLLTNLACNTLINMARRVALRAEAVTLAELMERVQYDAYGNSSYRGLRFSRTAGGWQYAVYQDEDGDGVWNADILTGVDSLVEGPFPLSDRVSIASIGVPPWNVPDPDTGKPFPATMQPVNFNQSSICSFAPDGDATPGSIYLVNGSPGEAAMVRSSGKGGRIRALFYGLRGSGWQP
jgi:prepilin-type N-terminal cleavage/methylation domain-containing protein